MNDDELLAMTEMRDYWLGEALRLGWAEERAKKKAQTPVKESGPVLYPGQCKECRLFDAGHNACRCD